MGIGRIERAVYTTFLLIIALACAFFALILAWALSPVSAQGALPWWVYLLGALALIGVAGASWGAWEVGSGRAGRVTHTAAGGLVMLVGIIGLALMVLWRVWVWLPGPSLLLLAAGLSQVWRGGRRRSRASAAVGEAQPSRPADLGAGWVIAPPGADLMDFPLSERPLAHLAEGSPVTEVRRIGEYVRVRSREGLAGWVVESELRPLEIAGAPLGSTEDDGAAIGRWSIGPFEG